MITFVILFSMPLHAASKLGSCHDLVMPLSQWWYRSSILSTLHVPPHAWHVGDEVSELPSASSVVMILTCFAGSLTLAMQSCKGMFKG